MRQKRLQFSFKMLMCETFLYQVCLLYNQIPMLITFYKRDLYLFIHLKHPFCCVLTWDLSQKGNTNMYH
jgi:uncharacterized protein VirK/YbjX